MQVLKRSKSQLYLQVTTENPRVSSICFKYLGKATDEDFVNFKKEFDKHYNSQEEQDLRQEIFRKHEDKIKEQHEKFLNGTSKWDAKRNPLEDRSDEEIKELLGIKNFPSVPTLSNEGRRRKRSPREDMPPPPPPDVPWEEPLFTPSIPDEWNWVTKGAVSPAKSQVCRVSIEAVIIVVF